MSNDAARVNGERISGSDFDALLEAFSTVVPENLTDQGTVYARTARNLLTDWITTVVIERALAAEGVTVTDADNDEAMSALMNQPTFASADGELRAVYAHIVAVRNVLENHLRPDDSELSARYEEGVEASGVACVRAILTDTEDEIMTAADRLGSGEDFADVAAEVSTAGSATDGGIVANPADGTECIAADQLSGAFNPLFVEALLNAEVGVPSDPFELDGVGWVVVLLRPFDEVADEAAAFLSDGNSSGFIDAAVADADIWVSPKYGVFDPTVAAVVAAD